MSERTARWWLWLSLVVVTGLRIAYLAGGSLDLSEDEAHYWEWSRRLDLAYYSKGPLVAYLIRALTSTLGTSALAIRLGAVALSVVGALIIFRLAREMFPDPRIGLWAVVALQLTPLFWAGSLLLTIDAPFIVLWVLTLLLLRRGLVESCPWAWGAAGLAVGLGVLTKYTMLFVLPGLALYLWRAPEARRTLRTPGPWIAALLALVTASPVIVWNLEHGWVSARHVASQGRGGGPGLATVGEFLVSQAGVLTPLAFGLLAWAAWFGVREGLAGRREPYRFLAAFAVPILASYLAVSVQGKVQANWPAAAYPPLTLVAVGALAELRPKLSQRRRRSQTRLLAASVLMAAGVSAIGHAPDLLGVPPRLDPSRRLKGWRELGTAVSDVRRRMADPERTFLLSDRYQVTSELAFYVEGSPPAYNVNLGRRLNQYDFWPGPEARLGWDAIFVREGTAGLDARVEAAFERLEGPSVVEVWRRGQLIRSFVVYRGYGFRGVAPSRGPTTY